MPRRANGEGTIYKRADGRYEAAAHVTLVDGTRKRLRLTARTREEAQRLLLERLSLEQKNIPTPMENWRLGAYLDYWLESVVAKNARPLTYTTCAQMVRRHLKPMLGAKQLAKLSVRDVQTAIQQMQDDGQGSRTIMKFRANLRAALNNAMREELIFRNVASLAKIPTWERKPITPWTVEEAARFLDEAREHRLHTAFLLLVTYGLREGELLGLRWDDVDFKNGVLNIRQQIQRLDGALRAVPVKTSASQRTLPLVPTVREELLVVAAQRGLTLDLNRPPEPGPLSVDNLVNISLTGGPIEAQNFLRSFRAVTKRAGVRNITIHHVRHTAATLLGALGVDGKDAQLILGHSNITTTRQIYQHGNVEQQRSAILAVESALAEASVAATTTPDDTTGHTRCRQPLPSNDSETIESENKQEPPLPTATGVNATDLDGGSSQTRTGDTRLFRPYFDPFVNVPTPVAGAAWARMKRMVIGCVAVNRCRQIPDSATRAAETLRLGGYIDARDAWQGELVARRLQSLSLAHQLLPPTQPDEQAGGDRAA